jgi:hypothetical protein
VYGSEVPARWRLHGKECDYLEEVVLDHVAQASGGFVKRATFLHAEVLG